MKAVRIAFLIGLSASILHLGCFLDKIGGGSNYSSDDLTPAGWHVLWQDQGTIATGLHTKLQVYQLFDAAMSRAGAAYQVKYGIPAQAYFDAIGKHYHVGFTLIDNARFGSGGGAIDSHASYATGLTQGPAVTLAFYNDNDAGTAVPPFANSPTWTWLHDAVNGHWYFGTEDPGEQYPALEYETFVNILGLPW